MADAKWNAPPDRPTSRAKDSRKARKQYLLEQSTRGAASPFSPAVSSGNSKFVFPPTPSSQQVANSSLRPQQPSSPVVSSCSWHRAIHLCLVWVGSSVVSPVASPAPSILGEVLPWQSCLAGNPRDHEARARVQTHRGSACPARRRLGQRLPILPVEWTPPNCCPLNPVGRGFHYALGSLCDTSLPPSPPSPNPPPMVLAL